MRHLSKTKDSEYAFAFLVHPRNLEDVYRKYPFFKYFPKKFVLWFLLHFWPVVVSEITGLKSQINKNDIKGYIISIPITAHQMLENRELSVGKIIDALKLAEKKGVKIAGLGALTSSVTKGGLDLVGKTSVNITTGHAYTAYTVTSNVFKLVEILGIDKSKAVVAVVGATGSIGSSSAKIMARAGFGDFILIDQERKKHLFGELIMDLKELNKNIKIKISHKINSIKQADIIITATNAPEALVMSEDLKSGAIIVDDAQPSDVAPEVLDREDVLVVEGGVVHTSNIKSNFNFGLKDEFDNFCCLCEVMILASKKWNNHYVLNRATLELVDEISKDGDVLGFRLADFQNFKEVISQEKIKRIKNIIRNR